MCKLNCLICEILLFILITSCNLNVNRLRPYMPNLLLLIFSVPFFLFAGFFFTIVCEVFNKCDLLGVL